MSRTDKDTPYWVTATWWKPHHDFSCARFGLGRGRRCDLPDAPVRAHPSGPRHACRWAPAWDRYEPGCPPRWYVTLVFRGPERRRVRDDCRRAVAEHRATDEVDIIPPTTQHRHQAYWEWW